MLRTVDWYISKGFSQKAAEYFAAGRKKIIAVEAKNDFTLLLTFDNGEQRIYDVAPLIKRGGVFENIKNISDFKRVYLDSSNCVSWDIDPNINSEEVWENKIDLCPDSCYIDSIPLPDTKQTA